MGDNRDSNGRGAVAKNETDKTAPKLVFKLDPPKFGSDAATEISATKKGVNVSTTAAGLKEVSKLEEELKNSGTPTAIKATGCLQQKRRIIRSIDESSHKMFFESNCSPSGPPFTKPASCPKPCPSPKPCPRPKPCPNPKPCPCPKPCPPKPCPPKPPPSKPCAPKPCDCPKPCPCPLTCPCPASCCKPPPPCCLSDDIALSGRKPLYEIKNINVRDKITSESATMRALRHMMKSDTNGNHNTFDAHPNSEKGDSIQLGDTGHVPLKGHKDCPLDPAYICPPCCVYPQIMPCPFSCCPTPGPTICTTPVRCLNESKFYDYVDYQAVSKQRPVEEQPKRLYKHLWKPYSRLRRNLLSMKRNRNGPSDLSNIAVNQKPYSADKGCITILPMPFCWGGDCPKPCPCSTTCCPTRPPCCSSAPLAACPNPEVEARKLTPDVQAALPLSVPAPMEEPLRNIPQLIWRKLDSNLLTHLLMNTFLSNTSLKNTDLPLSNYSDKIINQDKETVLANKCGPCCCMPPCPKLVPMPIPPCCRPPPPPPSCCPPSPPPCCPGVINGNEQEENSSVIVKINPLIGKSKKIIQFRGNGRHKRGNNGPEKYSIFLEFPESFFSNSKLRSLYSSLIGEDGAVAKNETDKTATKLVFKLDPPKFGSDAATEISAKKKGMNVSTTAAGLKEVSKLEEELKKSATLRAFATTGTSKQGSRIGRSIDDSSNKMFFEPNCPPSSLPCTKPPSFPSSCPASCPKPCPSPKPCPCPKPCPTPKPCPCPKPCPPKPCDCPKPCPCPLTCPCPASCCKPPSPCCPSDDVQLSGKKASPTYEVTNKNIKDKIADESATMRALRHMMRSDPRGNHNTFDSHSNSGKGDIQMDDTGHVPLKGHKGCPLVPSYLCPPCCIYPQIRPCPFSCCPTLGPLVCTSPARCPNESKFYSDVEHQVISKQRRIEEHPKRIYQHFLWKPYSRLRRNLLSMKRNGNGSRDLNTTNMVVDQKPIFANRSCVKLPTVCWGCPCSTTSCPTRPPCGSSRPPCCSSAPQAASPNPEFAARELSPDVQSALPLIVQAPVEEPLRNIPQFIWRKLDSNLLSHLLMNTSISNTVLSSTDLDTIPVFDDPPLSNYSEKNISQDNETVLANKCGPCCCMPPCPKVVSVPIPPCCRPLPTPPPPCCPPPSPPCCPGSKLVNSEKHNSNWRKLNSRLRKDLSRSISVGDLVLNGTSHSRRHIRLNTNKHQDSRGKNRPAASVPTI